MNHELDAQNHDEPDSKSAIMQYLLGAEIEYFTAISEPTCTAEEFQLDIPDLALRAVRARVEAASPELDELLANNPEPTLQDLQQIYSTAEIRVTSRAASYALDVLSRMDSAGNAPQLHSHEATSREREAMARIAQLYNEQT